jgi:hypothetical protein
MMKPNEVKTEYYRVEGGALVPLPKNIEKLLTEHGLVPPNGNEVVTIPNGRNRVRRLAIYPPNSPRAVPYGAPVLTAPGTFGPSDLKNLLGPYLPALLRKALKIEQSKWSFQELMLLILGVVNFVGLIALIVVCVKAFREAGLL